MSPSSKPVSVIFACFAITVAACAPATDSAADAAATVDAAVAADLSQLRALVEPVRTLEAAQAAGWNVLVPDCRDNQPEGGMGWHYLRAEYVDAEVEVGKPEVLMFEPQEGGAMRFVGVEYIIPFDIRPDTDEPPTLMGQSFQQNFGDRVWMLHVWLDEHNHANTFRTWNPSVSCRFAT